MPGYTVMGRLATLESSKVRWPSHPASTNPAVEWINSPSRPSEDLPSRRATSVGQAHALQRRSQDELAGVEDERLAVGDLDELGEVLEILPDVDHADGVIAEEPKVAVDVQVDGRRLDALGAERVDDNPFGIDLFTDRPV